MGKYRSPDDSFSAVYPFRYAMPDDYECGCKVEFRYYLDKTKAEAAVKVAIAEGKYKAGQGFDFGYRAPGEMHFATHGKRKGMWEVVCP